MSINSSAPVDPSIAPDDHTADSRGADALRLFDDLVFDNPEICSQCCERIRDHDELDVDPNRLGTGNRPTETLERAGAGVIGHDSHQRDKYGARQAHYARTYCGECGSPGGTADGSHIRSLQQARGRLDNITRRLHEQGYYPDVGAMYHALESLKTDPDKQGADREIFAACVYLGIERGRERTGIGGLVRADAMPPITRRPVAHECDGPDMDVPGGRSGGD